MLYYIWGSALFLALAQHAVAALLSNAQLFAPSNTPVFKGSLLGGTPLSSKSVSSLPLSSFPGWPLYRSLEPLYHRLRVYRTPSVTASSTSSQTARGNSLFAVLFPLFFAKAYSFDLHSVGSSVLLFGDLSSASAVPLAGG